ncbi:MAG: Ig-like domain-containing protein, partial [Verrucomicrobia bacterium]|nr:Ig-like domain-containing protein [Verrucomicrobiota bacterium]
AQTLVRVNDNESTPLHFNTLSTLTEGGYIYYTFVNVAVPVANDVTVFLSAEPPNQIDFGQLGAFAIIPQGQTSGVFQVHATDNRRIDGTRTAKVIASVANWPSGTNTITILDDENTSLALMVAPFLLEGFGFGFDAAVVGLSGTLTTNLTVQVTCDNPLVLPLGPVVIRASQTNAFFSLWLWDDPMFELPRAVTFTATAPGFASAQSLSWLLDNDGAPTPGDPSPPDLADTISLVTDLAWGPKEGEMILNGSFELLLANWTREGQGAGGWVSAAATYDPTGPEGPQSALGGSRYAISQQYGNGRHTLWQEVALPTNTWPIILSWAQRVHNYAPRFDTNQQLRVELRDPDNAVLLTLFTNQPAGPLFTDWTNITVDVSAFRGQTVRLAFIEEDALGDLNVSLDNVSLIATPPAPTSWLVYFGTDTTPDATELLGSTTNTTWSLGNLKTNTTYYWQIQSVRAGQTNVGPIWQFTTTEDPNHPPVIGLGSPGAFSVFRSPTNILMSPRTLTDDGSVRRVEYYGDGAQLGQTLASPWSLTWTNPPPGEHAIQVVAQDDGGLRSTSSVVYVSVLPPSGALMALVPFGSTWRYHDQGANLGTSWRPASYVDGDWSSGPAQLGFGEDDEATVVGYGLSPKAKYLTTYFRKSFSAPSGVQSLWVRVLRDDGVAVFLNGNEVLRDNLLAGALYNTPATNVSGASKTVLVTGTALATNLNGRLEVIAAEVHLASAASVAMSFDLELSAVENVKPTVNFITPVANSLFFTPASVPLKASAFDPYGAVSQVEFLAGNTSLGSVSNAPYTLTWSNAPAGTYLLAALVTDDQGATRRSADVPIFIVGPRPTLTITSGAGQIILSTPLTSIGYRVETTTDLTPPALWLPVADAAIATNGSNLQLSIPTIGEPQFFRLTAP